MRIITQLAVVCGLALNAQAGLVDYKITGIWGASAPSGSLSAPNTPFSVTFSLNAPVVPSFTTANRFDTSADVTYSLGGVETLLPAQGMAFTSGGDPLFVLFTLNQFAVHTGVPVFSGSSANPELLLGTFPSSLITVNYGGGNVAIGTGQLVANTPEPATWGLMLVSLGLVGAKRWSRRS